MTLPGWIVTRRGRLVLAWLALAAVLLPAAGRAERSLEVAARIHGSESAAVERLLASEFASSYAYYAILVLTGLPAPEGPEGEAVLAGILAGLGDVPGVAGSFSFLDLADTVFVAAGGAGTFAVVGLDPGTEPVDVLIPRLRAAIGAMLPALRERYPTAALRLTGEAALNFDLRRTSTEQANGAERRVLPLTLALLLFAFGALIAAFLPVVTGVLAIPIALGASVLLAEQWPLSILLVNVVSMIGLGLGIDYGLLTVSRFREALNAGASARQAAEEATRHAGHTVVLSGAAVAIGFAALLLVPLNEIRSVAVGGLLVVTASVLLATTLLPGLLAWLGPRVNLGRVRRRPARRAAGEGWRRWGYWVASNPGRVLALTGVPVLVLSTQGLRLNTELPRGDWLPPAMESAAGLRELEAMRRGAAVQTIRVVLQLPEGMRALDRRGWAATRQVAESLSADPRAARVQSLPGLVRVPTPSAEIIARLPANVLRSFVSTDQHRAPGGPASRNGRAERAGPLGPRVARA